MRRRRVDANNIAVNIRRTRSIQWFLPSDDTVTKKRVCKSFFARTLSLGKCAQSAITALHHKDASGVFGGIDNRGKHKPWNKTPDESIRYVKQHISDIPRMDSHYCRKRTKRQYIDPDLTITKLYELYLE